MAIKVKYNDVPVTAEKPVKCYKIVRKTFAYKHLVDDADINRFHAVYETIMQSYDVTEYIENKSAWTIPNYIYEESETKKRFGFLPVCKIVKEGYIFSYSENGIKEYVKTLKHNRSIYGSDHFCHDLRIFECEIPTHTLYYTGDNNGMQAFASKALIFNKDVTSEFID